MVKNLHAMQDPDWGLIPGLRRASGEVKWVPTQVFLHGEFHGHRGASWTTIHGVTKSQTLSLSRPFITFCIGNLCISYRERLYKHNYTTVITPYKITNCCSLSTCFSQFSSVAQSCPTLCNPMNRSMPGLPVHHQLPEFTQTHVHWVGDAI